MNRRRNDHKASRTLGAIGRVLKRSAVVCTVGILLALSTIVSTVSIAGATTGQVDHPIEAPTAVAVGAQGTILSTIDSIHWTHRHSGVHTNLYGITRSWSAPPGTSSSHSAPPLWVAVGAHGTILHSKDGITWWSDQSPTRNKLLAVATDSSSWIAVGSDGTVLDSSNGLTWTVQPSGTNETLRSVSQSTNSGNQWVVGGDHVILDSQDNGRTWTHTNTMGDPGEIHSVLDTLPEQFGAPSTWLAAGAPPSTASSGHGTDETVTFSPPPVQVLQSDDGVNWGSNLALSNEAELPLTPVNSLAQNSIDTSTVTAVGDSGEILSSANGMSWTALNSDVTANLFGVSIGLGGSSQPMIAVGADGTILTSPTGYTWARQPSGTHQVLYGVCPNYSAASSG